jgi:hypothetical protein
MASTMEREIRRLMLPAGGITVQADLSFRPGASIILEGGVTLLCWAGRTALEPIREDLANMIKTVTRRVLNRAVSALSSILPNLSVDAPTIEVASLPPTRVDMPPSTPTPPAVPVTPVQSAQPVALVQAMQPAVTPAQPMALVQAVQPAVAPAQPVALVQPAVTPAQPAQQAALQDQRWLILVVGIIGVIVLILLAERIISPSLPRNVYVLPATTSPLPGATSTPTAPPAQAPK